MGRESALDAGAAIHGAWLTLERIARSRDERPEVWLPQIRKAVVTACEDTRRHIARELHDDVSQRLVALALDVLSVEQTLVRVPGVSPEQVRKVRQGIEQLALDVSRLTHTLHPATSGDFDLIRTLRSECDLTAERWNLDVAFEHGHLPDPTPREASLTVFRIAQEALRNAVRHARAKRVDVGLTAIERHLHLTVEDDGVGFAPREGRSLAGLGLVSMTERAKLCGGEFFVHSAPNEGSRIEARIPWVEDARQDRRGGGSRPVQ